MKMRRATIAIAGVLAGVFALAGCGSSGGEAKGGVPLVHAGQLTVCSDVPYAPFEDFDTSAPSGFKGFDVDIVTQIAKDLGTKLVIQKSSFDPLQSGATLNAGQCDLGASAMTITDQRKKHIDFSTPYYDSKQSLLVPAGSSIHSIADLAGKTLGVQKATTGATYAEEHVKNAKKIVAMDNDGVEFQALKAGNVDALLQDLPVNLLHTTDGKFKVVQTYSTGEQYGLAVKKGNTKLLDAVNKSLAKMKSDGQYQKLYDKYFKQK